jgi:hypothetical protein
MASTPPECLTQSPWPFEASCPVFSSGQVNSSSCSPYCIESLAAQQSSQAYLKSSLLLLPGRSCRRPAVAASPLPHHTPSGNARAELPGVTTQASHSRAWSSPTTSLIAQLALVPLVESIDVGVGPQQPGEVFGDRLYEDLAYSLLASSRRPCSRWRSNRPMLTWVRCMPTLSNGARG